MVPTILALVLILGLIGGGIVIAANGRFMFKARAKMQVDNHEKRKAIRWSVVGSICCGVSFGVLVFLVEMATPEIEGAILAKILTALSLGLGAAVALLGGILFTIIWFEKIDLPARRKRKSIRSEEEG